MREQLRQTYFSRVGAVQLAIVTSLALSSSLSVSAGAPPIRLLGVSALSVYKWESGNTRPRARQIEAIAALRSMGKRDVAQRLEE